MAAPPLMVPHGAPPSFIAHTYTSSFVTPHPRAAVWAWLCDPATFTDSQIPPWRVEFVDGGFETGVLNVHHGPFMNFAGVLGEIREGEYRDLQYFYGSYAISLRLLRPTRLQFWVADAEAYGPGATRIRVQIDALVRRGLERPWDGLQRLFWARFARWMDQALRA